MYINLCMYITPDLRLTFFFLVVFHRPPAHGGHTDTVKRAGVALKTKSARWLH
jgi:hypothetical protein